MIVTEVMPYPDRHYVTSTGVAGIAGNLQIENLPEALLFW